VRERETHQDDLLVLFQGPGLLVDVRVQMVVPSFTALFPNPSRQFSCNFGPFLGTIDSNKLTDLAIFLFTPRSFGEIRI
jgi:hypothetical protein